MQISYTWWYQGDAEYLGTAVSYIILHACRLEYDEESNTYHNRTGVGIKAAGFGITCRIEHQLATSPEEKCGKKSKILKLNFYEKFVNYFVEYVGYERDRTIRAAPYDWRLTPGMCTACSI